MDYTYTINEEKNCRRVIEIEIPKEKVDEKFDEVYKLLKKEASIPGFRPGKAPLSIIKTRFGKDAREEVGITLIKEAIADVIEDSKLRPVTPPDIPAFDFKEGESLKFKATIEIAPEIKLEKITGFTIKKESEEITEGDLERAYNAILDIDSSLEISDEPAKEGDFVTVDMEKTFDPENRLQQNEFKDFVIELSKNVSLPEFLEVLPGTKPGDEKEIAIEYPLDYHENVLAGARLRFKVKVTAVKKKVPPELTNEFFEKFGDDIKSVDELKAKIREDLEIRRKKEVQEDIREQVIKSVIVRNEFEFPQSFLDKYLDGVVEDFKKQYKDKKIDEDEIRQKYRAVGIRMIRWDLLYHEIAEQQDIKAEKEDVDKWIESFADNYGMALEKAKETLEQNHKVQEVKETVLEDKVISHILDNSDIVDAEISGKELL